MESSSVDTLLSSSRASTLVANETSSSAAVISQSPGQPLERQSVQIDPHLIEKIERGLKKFEPLFKPSSKRRTVLGLALSSIGASLGASGTSTSTGNLGAASTAFAKVSAHLDLILQKFERTSETGSLWCEFLTRGSNAW